MLGIGAQGAQLIGRCARQEQAIFIWKSKRAMTQMIEPFGSLPPLRGLIREKIGVVRALRQRHRCEVPCTLGRRRKSTGAQQDATPFDEVPSLLPLIHAGSSRFQRKAGSDEPAARRQLRAFGSNPWNSDLVELPERGSKIGDRFQGAHHTGKIASRVAP